MMKLGKTPIAWFQLRFQKAQTVAAILGIAFTTILLFMQIGFRSGFLDTFIDLPTHLRGDLVVMNAGTGTILRPANFSKRRLYQTLAFDKVESVTPIYMSTIAMRDPTGAPRLLRQIQVIGFPLVGSPLAIAEVDANLEALKRGDALLIDERSRPEFLPIIDKVRRSGRTSIEVRAGGRQTRVSVEGLFSLGSNVSNDSHVLSSDQTFFELLKRDPNLINVGLVTLKPDADAETVARELDAYLPRDVAVFDMKSLIAEEIRFYEHGTALGTIFRFGLGGAIVIGVVILYQILYQIISKYMREYATLRAIGFSQGMLRIIVLKGALILAFLGFLPGFVASLFVYHALTAATNLRFAMSIDAVIVVLVAVCLICLMSALLAVRKLRDADPADLFG